MNESWPAPAKLNLYLHVTGRRPDGFHTLDTQFQFIDYGDELSFELTNDSGVGRRSENPGIAEDQDLTVRAARALQAASGCRRGVRIELIKRTPVGGGLGGGSSDAATVLLVLNRLWGINYDLDKLAALGVALGADVPVFVRGRAATAGGIGDILTPASPPESTYVVVIPPVKVATSGVFAAWDRQRDLTPPGGASKIRGFRADTSRNDLEPIVRNLYPEVDNAMNWLAKFGSARMTGSGACVFVVVESAAAGGEILASLPENIGKGIVARGVNVHPVHVRLYGQAPGAGSPP